MALVILLEIKNIELFKKCVFCAAKTVKILTFKGSLKRSLTLKIRTESDELKI